MLISVIAAAPVAPRSTHDVLWAALIAALAAIVGGIIGGAIPGYFTLKAEDKRHAHALELARQAREDERERERRAVVGTARAFSEFFARVDTIYGVALKGGRWWGDDLDATIQPPSLDDQKAVLGQLLSYEAGVIASSMRLIEFLRAHREVTRADSEDLRAVDKEHLEGGRRVVKDAITYLRRVAELPEPEA